MNIIPYFYYDIVARIIPGAVTLYVLALTNLQMPEKLTRIFTGKDTLNGITATLVLGGAAYAIGVFYEALFYFPGVSSYKTWAAGEALKHAIDSYPWKNEALKRRAQAEKNFGYFAWEKLVAQGSKDSTFKSLFAHCHRFQAEAKMCQHLLVPTALYAGLAVSWKMPDRAAFAAVALLSLGFASFWRDERRWCQVFSFVEIENFIPQPSPVAAQKPPSCSK